jgi:NAD(P)H-hydrate epimerase
VVKPDGLDATIWAWLPQHKGGETVADYPIYAGDVPYLTTGQMIEVDRAMMEDYRIGLIQMMENAGRALAHLARRRFLGGDPRGSRVTVLSGTGGNGGGALVCARRLHNYGARVEAVITKPVEQFAPVPARQLGILRRMGVAITLAGETGVDAPTDLIVDGVIGYSLHGAPRGPAADLIRRANGHGAPILALDVPSGVDAGTGEVFDPAIRAAATLTLALPKEGLRAPGAGQNVGELYLADIGVPPDLYAGPGLGLSVGPIFAKADILRLR